MSPDVLVIGAGVAGVSAAVAAASRGAKVVVATASPGLTALAGGAWDVATDLAIGELPSPRLTESLSATLERYRERHPHHPYRRVEPRGDAADLLSTVLAAHRQLMPHVGSYGALGADSVGPLLATHLGTARRPACAQAQLLDLDGVEGRLHVVGFPGAGRDAARAYADSLHRSWCGQASVSDTGQRVRDREVVAQSRPLEVDPEPIVALAHRLDRDDLAIERFAKAVLAGCSPGAGDAVLVPPLLGIHRDDIRRRVEEIVGAQVGEWNEPLASPQSLRLARGLSAALERSGCRLSPSPVSRVQHLAGSDALVVELVSGETMKLGAVVLASGSFTGGGLELQGGNIVEPLVGLPVHVEGRVMPLPSSARGRDPAGLFGRDPIESGPGFRCGVGYDPLLRPLDIHGGVFSPRLFAAGAVLDGFDPARDGSGLGCAATTGYLAGVNATSAAG